jgi:hypothetical protein
MKPMPIGSVIEPQHLRDVAGHRVVDRRVESGVIVELWHEHRHEPIEGGLGSHIGTKSMSSKEKAGGSCPALGEATNASTPSANTPLAIRRPRAR